MLNLEKGAPHVRDANWLYELARQHQLELMREAECDRLADSAQPTATPPTFRRLHGVLTLLTDELLTIVSWR